MLVSKNEDRSLEEMESEEEHDEGSMYTIEEREAAEELRPQKYEDIPLPGLITPHDLLRFKIEQITVPWKVNRFYSERELFRTPYHQRDYVQPEIDARYMILWMLYNLPLTHLSVSLGSERGYTIYNCIDGGQRTKTIYAFLEDQLRTPTPGQLRRANPNTRLSTFERPHLFSELPDEMRRRFREYSLSITEMTVPPELEGELFTNLNKHTPMTAGQHVWAYHTKIAEAARDLWEWSNGWSSVYKRKKYFYEDRPRHRILAAVMLFLIEMAGRENFYFQSIPKDIIMHRAAGFVDDRMTNDLIGRVLRKLALCGHLFLDAGIQSRTSLLVMYQAVSYLLDMGFFLEAAEPGCLTPWFKTQIAKKKCDDSPCLKAGASQKLVL